MSAARTRGPVRLAWCRLLVCVAMMVIGLRAWGLCIGCSCTVNNPALVFGTYQPLAGSPVTSTATITMACTTTVGLLVNYSISLSPGGSANYGARYLSSGANHLFYNLYTSAGMSSIWGNGSGATQVVSGSLTLSLLGTVTRNATVYGVIPAGQNTAVPGIYSDTIAITLTYD